MCAFSKTSYYSMPDFFLKLRRTQTVLLVGMYMEVKIQERALRIVYKDNHSDFETLLVNQNSASVPRGGSRLNFG